MIHISEVIRQDKKEAAYSNTWGHLAPKNNVTYKGTIKFSKSHFYSGNNPIIDFEFDNIESSPWLFNAIEDKLSNLDLEKGFAYSADITFRNYRIWIKIKNKF